MLKLITWKRLMLGSGQGLKMPLHSLSKYTGIMGNHFAKLVIYVILITFIWSY